MKKMEDYFYILVHLIQLQLLLRISMGCGAVCGNNNSIYQPNKYSQEMVRKLLPLIKCETDLISVKTYQKFITQIKCNPIKYRLKVTNKLVPNQSIEPSILVKWKIIIYCIDSSNTQYYNCLGFTKKSKQIVQKAIDQVKEVNGQQLQQVQSQEQEIQEQYPTIYYHKQFTQIEKDLQRTFELPQNLKKPFQNVLKRITNHFPKMGYTQGINFIIGYLLIIGYSELDTFWFFTHIAINRRYLLLGLFEDGFPLSEIYKVVFKNVLKRKNPDLYEHLYVTLDMDESMWVFKWFFTYFIYSFPIEMIKYVLDIVIEIGGIGLVSFAIGITEELSSYLLQQHDVGEISIFFQSLKKVEVFNKHINLNKVIEQAYKLEVKKEDFQGISSIGTDFYSQFVMKNLQQQSNQKQIDQIKTAKKVAFTQKLISQQMNANMLINNWYRKLKNDRLEFVKNNKRIKRMTSIRVSIEKQLDQVIGNFSQTSVIEDRIKYNSQKSDIQEESIDKKQETTPSTGYSFNIKNSRIRHCDIASEIDQLWEQEDDNNSSISKSISGRMSQQSRTQNGFEIKIKKASYQEEIDKMASTQNIHLGKSKNNYSKSSSIFSNSSSFKPKINNFQVEKEKQKSNHLIMTGQSIINNISLSNTSHYQSSHSQSSKFSSKPCKQKKQKQNQIQSQICSKNRNININKSYKDKIKTEQKNPNIIQDSSQKGSSMIPEESYMSNQSIREEIRNQADAKSLKFVQSHRQRISTHQQFLTTSLQASQIKKIQYLHAQSMGSEIQIFQAQQVFKKKNKGISKINGAIGSQTGAAPKKLKLAHTISQVDIAHVQRDKMIKNKIPKFDQNDEQSYQSIYTPSQVKNSRVYPPQQDFNQCEIESIK